MFRTETRLRPHQQRKRLVRPFEVAGEGEPPPSPPTNTEKGFGQSKFRIWRAFGQISHAEGGYADAEAGGGDGWKICQELPINGCIVNYRQRDCLVHRDAHVLNLLQVTKPSIEDLEQLRPIDIIVLLLSSCIVLFNHSFVYLKLVVGHTIHRRARFVWALRYHGPLSYLRCTHIHSRRGVRQR